MVCILMEFYAAFNDNSVSTFQARHRYHFQYSKNPSSPNFSHSVRCMYRNCKVTQFML